MRLAFRRRPCQSADLGRARRGTEVAVVAERDRRPGERAAAFVRLRLDAALPRLEHMEEADMRIPTAHGEEANR